LLYIDNIDKQIVDMKSYFEENKNKQAKICAHSLKTAFKYFGMEDTAEIAKEVELNSETFSIDVLLSKSETITENWENGKNEARAFCDSVK